jgi:hypothetical protein
MNTILPLSKRFARKWGNLLTIQEKEARGELQAQNLILRLKKSKERAYNQTITIRNLSKSSGKLKSK